MLGKTNETHNQYFYYARRYRNIKMNYHNPLLYKQMQISMSSWADFRVLEMLHLMQPEGFGCTYQTEHVTTIKITVV